MTHKVRATSSDALSILTALVSTDYMLMQMNETRAKMKKTWMRMKKTSAQMNKTGRRMNKT